MSIIRVTCLAGAGTVTGSNYLIETPGGKKFLVDCGLFQGGKQIESRNWDPWGFSALADLIHQRFNLEAHVPRWKERLILKPRQVAVEAPKIEEAQPDIQTMMYNAIVDLEKQIKELKKLVSSKQWLEKGSEEDVERIQYINEELTQMLG